MTAQTETQPAPVHALELEIQRVRVRCEQRIFARAFELIQMGTNKIKRGHALAKLNASPGFERIFYAFGTSGN
ncbi:TPA: hypothetical protein DDW35_13050 [Candidatus Sumerlaeota bacterium]|jgi:hypothetical protein|nr:hypothetical protein [Candidatus Sumerlaeota bacterium]